MDERLFTMNFDFIDVKSLQKAFRDYLKCKRDDWRLKGTLALFQESSDVNGRLTSYASSLAVE